jgi:arsenical pump membrane protein
MSGVVAELIALGLLAAVLVFAMVQPRGLPEATVAVPAAALAVGLGLLSPTAALRDACSRISETASTTASTSTAR